MTTRPDPRDELEALLRRLKQVGAGAALLAVAMLTALVLWVLFFRLPRF